MDNTDKEVVKENSSFTTQDQYLLFLAGGFLYAIEALKAQEIVEYSRITKVPMMSSFVKGVTNIRGNIVAVIDLLDRLGLGKIEVGDKTSIIVIGYEIDGVKTQIGIMIDEVYEVDKISTKRLKKAPEFGSKIDARLIQAMGKYKNEYIPILNTENILDIEELSKIVKG